MAACGVLVPKEKATGQRAAIVMAGVVNAFMHSLPFRVDVGVVEGQQVYRNGKADANGLLKVAAVSGAALGGIMFRATKVKFPLPREWKGGAPKGAHQARVLDDVGWEYEFDGPKRPPKIVRVPDGVDVVGPDPGVHWKEIVDAIGLALWGYGK